MAGEIVFQANTQAGAMLVAANRGLQSVLQDVEKVLKGYGEEWKRKVTRVTPRDTGDAADDWAMTFDRDAKSMSVTLSNPREYVKYLEYGTERIAGGRVKDWQPGDAPIMDWPAKHADLPDMRSLSAGSKRYEQDVTTAMRAFTQGKGEQMPMLRPIGYELAPKVIEDVQQAVAEGFRAVIEKRKG